MKHNISIKRVEKSKVEDLDFNNIPLGRTFTDHMFICDYENGQWNNPRVEPLAFYSNSSSCYGFALWSSYF